MINPWATPEGERARLTLFRLHAQGEGALADFAKDVVAGHRRPRDLLVQGGVLDDHLDDLRAAIERHHREPPPTGSLEDVVERVQERIAAINAYTPEEPPPELDNDRRSVLDDDDW